MTIASIVLRQRSGWITERASDSVFDSGHCRQKSSIMVPSTSETLLALPSRNAALSVLRTASLDMWGSVTEGFWRRSAIFPNNVNCRIG
jgi:hypothetical protein